MAVTIDAGAKRPVIIYIIVAIVLFASLLLCVRWVKNRTAYYSQTQVGQNQPAEQHQEQATAPGPEQPMAPAPTEQKPQPKPEEKPEQHAQTPAQVPSTGPEQFVLTIGSLGALAFAATGYLRARRRLLTLR